MGNLRHDDGISQRQEALALQAAVFIANYLMARNLL
jgi:hypothetical protein